MKIFRIIFILCFVAPCFGADYVRGGGAAGNLNMNSGRAGTHAGRRIEPTNLQSNRTLSASILQTDAKQLDAEIAAAAKKEAELLAEYQEKIIIRDQLKRQQEQIAENKRACEKAKKNWTIATVIGGIGTVGTTVGAIVQHNQIQEKEGIKTDLENKTKENNKK